MSISKKPVGAIIIGGIFFLLPVLAILVLVTRGIKILLPVGNKLVNALNIHSLFGAATITVVSLVLLLIIAYLSGLLLSKGFFRRWNNAIEEKLFLLFPNVQMLKYQMMDDTAAFLDKKWDAILLEEDGSFTIAFITDESYGSVLSLYIPDAPRIDAGEVRYVKHSACTFHPISMKMAMKALSHFGRNQALTEEIERIIAKDKE
ncbi:hypothetical protein [Owenweeksia hongkongensis]|uniref:hypothetical protein n=1 Tax=Owenweeksia hongkongensis TaxID=253245 RepID=UPI003A8DC7F5